MHDINPRGRHIHAEHQTATRKVADFDQVSGDSLQLAKQSSQQRALRIRKLPKRCGAAVGTGPVHYLASGLVPPQRDVPSLDAVARERSRLVADTGVRRKGVLEEHQHPTSRFLHTAVHSESFDWAAPEPGR